MYISKKIISDLLIQFYFFNKGISGKAGTAAALVAGAADGAGRAHHRRPRQR